MVAEISKELVDEGHEVVIAARSDGSRLHETGAVFESLGGIPWPNSSMARVRWKAESGVNHVFGWAWPAYLSYLASLRKVLRRSASPPDVMISHNDPMVIRFLRRWVPGATIVLWLHNRPYRLPRLHRPVDDADRVVTVSDFLAGEVAPILGVDRQKVATIHNGVDSSVFCPRTDFELPSTPLRVLCLGRLDVNKGADVALSAVRRLQLEGLAIELDVVGSPWFSPTPGIGSDPWGGRFVEQLVAAGARHIPHMDRGKVPELVRAHDVVCVLSRWDDPFPLVVLEAMASGCAVVATRRGGYPRRRATPLALCTATILMPLSLHFGNCAPSLVFLRRPSGGPASTLFGARGTLPQNSFYVCSNLPFRAPRGTSVERGAPRIEGRIGEAARCHDRGTGGARPPNGAASRRGVGFASGSNRSRGRQKGCGGTAWWYSERH